MKIVVDCRYLYNSGIGKYLEGILPFFILSNHEIILLGDKEKINDFGLEIIHNNTSAFSKNGLLLDTKRINECDVFFTPNFIIPFGIKIPVFSMIHDIIFLDEKYASNHYIDYLIKKFFLKRCAKKSKKVFTVSNFSKKRIKHHLKIDSIVAYSSITEALQEKKQKEQTQNYLLFVGNVKRNKGLDTLLEAFLGLKDLYSLIIVGEYENFRTSMDIKGNLENVSFTGHISDDELYELIRNAKFLIQPSRYEGFGLPPLEALYLGTKPIISDIEVFKEIYGEFDVAFFEVNNAESLEKAIRNSSETVNTNREMILKKYSFRDSARIILGEMEGYYEENSL